jgi:hypothetical protein
MLVNTTVSIVIFDLLSIGTIYLVQACLVLFASRNRAHQISEVARQDVTTQFNLFLPVARGLNVAAKYTLAFSLLLLIALRYLATLLSWRFQPASFLEHNGDSQVSLPWPSPGLNNYSAVCSNFYNCTADASGTENLIRTTLRYNGIANIDFPPLDASFLNYTIDHYTGATDFGFTNAQVYTGVKVTNETVASIYALDKPAHVESIINHSATSGVLQSWNPVNTVVDTVLRGVLDNIQIYFNPDKASGVASPCAYLMGPTHSEVGSGGFHLTDSCSELYISQDSFNLVLNTQLTLNSFQAAKNTTETYLRSGHWAAILGMDNINLVLNSTRTFNSSDLSIPAGSTQDTRYFWSTTYNQQGIVFNCLRLTMGDMFGNPFTFYDWQFNFSAYGLDTGLNTDSFYISGEDTTLMWPTDIASKPPYYVFLGKASIRDSLKTAEYGSNGTSVPAFDYGTPYPLPPEPNIIKFMFNENFTWDATHSSATVYVNAIYVDLPVYIIAITAVVLALGILGFIAQKQHSVKYYSWPLVKLIAASTESSQASPSAAEIKEASYKVVLSKDSQVRVLLNGQLIAVQSFESEVQPMIVDETYPVTAKEYSP